ncbi:glycoside hydrolase TIM-barrel-like domain-containing protein, partial [Hyphomonas sp.]|uniref:baseplate megatron protein TIM-barrel domain-containing protein n=1 Tax=Hyphomonas sp. TaxID=87 RepID=UPI00391DAD62
HPDVDFVGIDWYPPMGDWRDGAGHLDALAGYRAADDADYLAAQLVGGEAYDWYYANAEDRAAQIRTPIIDTAHGEHWVFRQKDLTGWAGAYHYPRPGGVRAEAPTGWSPGLKPVRLSEVGFAAVDKAGNAPNLFFDPKSSESGLPPFSNGGRDDVVQRRLLAAALGHFGGVAHVWAWDARPFPAWPMRLDVWGDGGNWARGHWLNGRSGLAPLSAVVADICEAGGVAPVDVSGLDGVVEGYVRTGVSSVRAALEPLAAAFGFEAVERGGTLVFRMAGEEVVHEVNAGAVNLDELRRTRQLMDKAPERLRLTCIDPEADHAPMVVEARRGTGDARQVADVALPLAVSAGRAEAIAAHLLASMTEARVADVSGGPELAALETGDRVRFGGSEEVWRIEAITDRGAERHLLLSADAGELGRARFGEPGRAPEVAAVYPQADLVVMDAPAPAGGEAGPLVAAFSDPWPGEMAVRAGATVEELSLRVTLEQPAVIGRLMEPVAAGPAGRWDRGGALMVAAPAGAFVSLPEAAVLAGGNSALLETEAGWELVQFLEAELVAPETWRLSGLLRGQGGGLTGAVEVGARFVLLDSAVEAAALAPLETGLELAWKAGTGEAQTERFGNRAGLPWQPCQLRVREGAASWIRRGREIADSWSFPDAPNEGRFAAEFDTGGGFGGRIEVDVPACAVPPGTLALRVAEIGPDGRTGPWLSIGPGSPYL